MDASKKIMGSCYQHKERVYVKEGESVSVFERRKREGAQVYIRTIEERVY